MNPAHLLTQPDVTAAIRASLLSRGWRKQDLQDGIHDVYLKALTSFQRSPPPPDVERMMALCAEIARNHAIDELRKAHNRKRDLLEKVDRDEYAVVEHGVVLRDPVDAGRQLEVLVQLFREGRMPEHGVDILEGVASKCTYEELGEQLGITADAVERRMRTMRKAFRLRMARLGMLPSMQPLQLIVSAPAAIAVLRRAA